MFQSPSKKIAASPNAATSETHHPRHSDYTSASNHYPPTRGSPSHHHHGERVYGGELESSRYHSQSHHQPQNWRERYESAPMLNDRFPSYDPQYTRERDREERHRRADLMQHEMYAAERGYGSSSSRSKRGAQPDSQSLTDPRYNSHYDVNTLEERYRERRGTGAGGAERLAGSGAESPSYSSYERQPHPRHPHSSASSPHPRHHPHATSPAIPRRHRHAPSSASEYERMMIQRRQQAMQSPQNPRRYRETRPHADQYDAYPDRDHEARMYQREMERRKIREMEQSQYRAELVGRHGLR